MIETALPNTSEFTHIGVPSYILEPGEITWMLTGPVHTQIEKEFVTITEE